MNRIVKIFSFFSLSLMLIFSACTPETFSDADGIKKEFTFAAMIDKGATDGAEIKVGKLTVMDEMVADVKENIEQKGLPTDGELSLTEIGVRQLRAMKENSQEHFLFIADIKVELVNGDQRILLGSLPEGDNNFYFSELFFEVNEAEIHTELEPGLEYDIILTANYTKEVEAPVEFDLIVKLDASYTYTSL